jgi:hypothetical protein
MVKMLGSTFFRLIPMEANFTPKLRQQPARQSMTTGFGFLKLKNAELNETIVGPSIVYGE